jgi:hypothetical protein
MVTEKPNQKSKGKNQKSKIRIVLTQTPSLTGVRWMPVTGTRAYF